MVIVVLIILHKACPLIAFLLVYTKSAYLKTNYPSRFILIPNASTHRANMPFIYAINTP